VLGAVRDNQLKVDFDDVGNFNQGFAALYLREVIECDCVARIAQSTTLLDHFRVWLHGFQDFDNDRLRREERNEVAQQRLFREVDEGRATHG